MKNLPAAVAAALAPCLAAAFSFDDVHFWAGEGTNSAAVVVDWSADGAAPLAWGWRWNGDATAADALRGIVREDPRLHSLTEDGKYGLSLYALGYDRADAAAAFRFDYNGGNIVAQASDPAALVAGGWLSGGYWAQWTAPTGGSFDASSLGYGNGLSYTPLADGSWHVLQFQRPEWGWDTHPLAGEPAAAESPYAWRVVDADVLAGGDYGDPANALGGPARTVPGWLDIPPTTVNPASPAWGPGRLVTLESATDAVGARGSVTLEFDHDVVDDPRNPFGLDFIVFGNAMQTIGGNAYFDGVSDPATVVFATDAVVAERGLVEVSADGKEWFAFADGPWADGFAPTMSHRYDPENPDRALFGDSAYTNEWWGAPSDATRPVDPAVSAAGFKGRSLADYARLYDGSAGGTGFDISGFDLPRDALGRKFVRFVRITTLDPDDGATEVDAVADVAPATAFRNWVDAHVPFEDRPGFATTNLCANGAPAFVNAAFGLAPDAPAPVAWAIEGFDPATRELTAPLAPFASDLVFLRSSATLTNAAWAVSLPYWTGTNAFGRPHLRVPGADAPAGFFRLELHE
ncbi:MAG: hypothetical protein II839_13405 [Kiritimatiellae bacterium]|nr:hypothetical protein [Kiritimatiellia bacterium]